RRLPGRDPGRDGAGSAGRQRGQGHCRCRRERGGAAGGGGRRLGGLRPGDPGGARREGRAEPAALPERAGAAPGAEEGDPDDHPGATAGRPNEGAPATARRDRKPGRGQRPGRGGGAGGRRAVPEAWRAGPMTVLVLVEHAENRPDRLSLEALSVAASLGGPVEALVVGRWSTELAGGLAGRGIGTVHVVDDPRLADFAPAAWAASLAQVAAARSAAIVIDPRRAH